MSPRYPVSLTLLALSLHSAACGEADTEAAASASPPPDIVFAKLGSIASADGAGSFRFGASTAATQIEDQNERTDWWAFTAPASEGGLAKAPFVGDASMGFTRALEDVDLLVDAGLETYRFSIEWARVEPYKDQIDEAALAHYRAVLEALVAAGIRPMVTLHHFSNPVWVDDPRDLECAAGPSDDNLCGLGDPVGGPLVIEQMAEHATLLAERFGDVVDEWGTLNEPVNYLVSSYGVGVFPPGKQRIFALLDDFIPVVRDYVEGHARMAAALRAADVGDADGDGSTADVGLTLSVQEWAPARFNEPSDDPADIAARDRVAYVYHHLLVDALTTGRFDSDLDGTGDEDHPSWQDTLDWLGLQYYARIGVTGNNGLLPVLEATPCYGTFDFGSCLPPEEPTWDVPTMHYEFWAPGLYERLVEFSARYPGLPLLVTESGLATEVGRRRAEHVVRSLEQIDRALAEGADVRGYYHWSLYDNFEWVEGFEPRFGLYHVDFDTYERTPTEGAIVLGDIARARTVTSAERQQYGGMGPMTPEG